MNIELSSCDLCRDHWTVGLICRCILLCDLCRDYWTVGPICQCILLCDLCRDHWTAGLICRCILWLNIWTVMTSTSTDLHSLSICTWHLHLQQGWLLTSDEGKTVAKAMHSCLEWCGLDLHQSLINPLASKTATMLQKILYYGYACSLLKPYQRQLFIYSDICPCGSRGHCRIVPPPFLAEFRMRRLNQG